MGFLDTLWKNVQNVFGSLGNAAQGAVGAVTNAGSKVGQGLATSAGKGIMNSFGPKQAQKSPMNVAMKSFAPSAGRMGASLFSGGAKPPTGGGFSQGVDTAPASKGNSILDMFSSPAGKIAGGIGTMGIGHLLGGSPKLPSFQTDAMQNYQNYNTGKLPAGVEDMINRTAQINEEQATKQLRDVYKNARPGTDYTTDAAYQRDLANLQRTQTLNRADAQAQALMGFNQQELSRASELAQLSIAEIMAKTGMEAEEAQSIKEMFGNIGGAMVSNGLGLDQFQV